MHKLTIGEALLQASKYLKENGCASPRLDAEVLMAHLLGRDRVYLFRESARELTGEEIAGFHPLIKRRAEGEPVAYLIGQKEFMGLDFMVGPHVLIPRPETELMVEYALALLAGWPVEKRIVVDVGTGSGAIAVSLAHFSPGAKVYATDISAHALELAKKNTVKHGVAVNLYHGDLLTPLQGVLEQHSVALITANLPYIPCQEIDGLIRDVRDYEPRLALDGGMDGLDYYRRLVPQAKQLLAENGHLLMEIAPDQSAPALALVPAPSWDPLVLKDLAGRPRLVAARHAGGNVKLSCRIFQ